MCLCSVNILLHYQHVNKEFARMYILYVCSCFQACVVKREFSKAEVLIKFAVDYAR